ncbi:MAG TPA: FGGY family carbohydrate kinase [Kofleriaceae bacterium]
MVVVGIDLGTQSLKAVVCNERLDVLGAHAVAQTTAFPRPGWAEQDPRGWEAALAPAIGGALIAAGVQAADVAAVALAGQLDGCVAVDTHGTPLHAALIWQDKRAVEHVTRCEAARLFELTGQIADASHMAPKARWLRAHGVAAARFHQPVSYLVERLTGAAVLDPAHASTTMLYDLLAGTWSAELLAAFELDAAMLPTLQPAHAVAGVLTAAGAALTGLVADIPVVVGTGDDFATPLGAGIVAPGAIACTLGTAEVIGAIAETPIFDIAQVRATSDPWRELAEPMVETHAFPTGAFFVENPGWLAGGAVRWAIDTFGYADEADFDRAAAQAPPGADGITFVPALTGAMTPVWRANARGTLHGLTNAHGRSHIARAVLEGIAFASRDVAQRLVALGLPAREVVLLGGGGKSAVWTQLRADALGLPHRVASRTDTCPVGAAMLALVAIGALPDVQTAAALAPAHSGAVMPQRSLDEAYERYRSLVMRLVTTTS